MNYGSEVGQAWGFRMWALSEVMTTKSSDSSQTLLQYIVDKVDTKSPEIHDFLDEMKEVRLAVRGTI